MRELSEIELAKIAKKMASDLEKMKEDGSIKSFVLVIDSGENTARVMSGNTRDMVGNLELCKALIIDKDDNAMGVNR